MRIIVVDNDKTFTTSLSQRCQKASVFCQVIGAAATAFAEIKKNPDQVDIVLIAKELGAGQDGLQVAQMLRKDPKTADVPYVLMSSTWGKPEFAKHQKTEFGANAYYSKKSSMTELESTIEAVTGFKFTAAPAAKSGSTGNTGLLNIKLEAASDVVNIAEDVPNDISMSEPIALFDEASPPAPAAPKAAAPPPPSPAPAPAAAAAAVV
ncbi:MAG: response regulator, partial [Deltaproteobacteria bacterium]|nr:response regulator [Deltaproteobacteria bacterium]